MRSPHAIAGLLVLTLTVPGMASFASGQSPASGAPVTTGTAAPPSRAATPLSGSTIPQPPGGTADVRRLTEDDAVRLALENNLGIQVSRIDPQIGTIGVASAQAAWQPALTSTLQQTSTDSPNTSFLSGTGAKNSDARFSSNISVEQPLPWGGSYNVGWDVARSTTTNTFSNFSPQLRSSLSASISQPLLRNFRIDSLRQQLSVSLKNREIADVQVRQSVESTIRTVRTGYWDLVFAIASLRVQQQSLDLANESLRNTRQRVQIGTTAPIDIVEAEAEVAQREEAVIVAKAQIETAQDTLRALVLDPVDPGFWTLQFDPADQPATQSVAVDVDQAVRTALDRRTDLQQSKKNLEISDINLRYLHDQTLPDVTAQFDYGLTGLGGTQLQRASGPLGPGTGDVTQRIQRGFGSVLGDLFQNQFPTWTASVNIRYPIGESAQDAGLARSRLQYRQSVLQLRSQQLQVVTQVRNTARQVETNRQRIETSRASRELSERRLDAEQRKLAAGTSTNFLVFQAQRDLAQARSDELRARIDYQQSVVDLQTVQEVPLGGGGGGATAVSAGTGGGGAAGGSAAGGGGSTAGGGAGAGAR